MGPASSKAAVVVQQRRSVPFPAPSCLT